MKILVIVDPQIPIPPHTYGGIERIVAYLCEALVKKGHEVTLMAGPGSNLPGVKLSIHRTPSRSFANRAFRKIWFQCLSLGASRNADVIVNFGRLDYLYYILRRSKPLLCCFQNPVDQPQIDWLLARRQTSLRLIGVSHSQIADLNAKGLFSVVHNCADTNRPTLTDGEGAGAYLAFLGRITFNKGADTAIRVARRCGLKLKLAGNISDEEGGREFFEKEIRPQLDSRIEWIGPVNDETKAELLAGAKALLFPIRWKEPCALVVPESLACGTPVIAMRCASTPEVIDDGETGFLCDNEEEMIAAVARLETIDRAKCREVAVTRFSSSVMTENYLRVIEELLEKAGTPND